MSRSGFVEVMVTEQQAHEMLELIRRAPIKGVEAQGVVAIQYAINEAIKEFRTNQQPAATPQPVAEGG